MSQDGTSSGLLDVGQPREKETDMNNKLNQSEPATNDNPNNMAKDWTHDEAQLIDVDL